MQNAIQQEFCSTRYRWREPDFKGLIDRFLPFSVPLSPSFSVSPPLDTEEVAGSNPVVSTINIRKINNLDGDIPL
jgi:hypothetical protein